MEDIKIYFWNFSTSNLDSDETPEAAVVDKRQTDKSSLLMNVTFSSGSSGRNKFDLVFQKESNVEIAKRRELAQQPYVWAYYMFPRILNLRFFLLNFLCFLFLWGRLILFNKNDPLQPFKKFVKTCDELVIENGQRRRIGERRYRFFPRILRLSSKAQYIRTVNS